MSSNQDHGPCHPFTMSSIYRLSQSPFHSGPISSYHPQVTRPEELNQKVFLVLLETTLARGASPFFPVLPFPSACTLWSYHIPLLEQLWHICIKYILTNLVLDLVFDLVVFDSILILNIVMPKHFGVKFFFILQFLCRFVSSWEKTFIFPKILPLYFFFHTFYFITLR